MSTVISVENLCKTYRLGTIGGGTLRADVSRWLARLRGKADPNLKIGQEHHARLIGQEFKALEDVSFEVKQGEILGVVGRNGAGKSTLLKILSRVTAPTSGEIKVKGRIASLLEVGTGFNPELTGRENIFLNGAILGMSKAEIRRKFDEIVEFSGVADFINTPVKRYSSGMYVRLAFAVAAHLEPEILIIDEVLAVGDAAFQTKCLGKMQDVSKGGRTVLFVSHNMAAISALTKGVLLLESGRAVFNGDTHQGVKQYLQSGFQKRGAYFSTKQNYAEPHIESITIDNDKAGSVHVSGKDLTIRAKIRHAQPIAGACFSIQIINQFQQGVVHCFIYDSDIPICRNTGSTELVCQIPNLSLNVGSYSLNAFLSEPPGGRFFEKLEAVCEFDVEILEKQTLFGWRPEACVFLPDFQWSVK